MFPPNSTGCALERSFRPSTLMIAVLRPPAVCVQAAGLGDVSVTEFSVPVTVLPHGRPGDIWTYWTLSSPLGVSALFDQP